MVTGMANRHFGKVADVWKHLPLVEILAVDQPNQYGETHAGSAGYRLVDDSERQLWCDALPERVGGIAAAGGVPLPSPSRRPRLWRR